MYLESCSAVTRLDLNYTRELTTDVYLLQLYLKTFYFVGFYTLDSGTKMYCYLIN